MIRRTLSFKERQIYPMISQLDGIASEENPPNFLYLILML
jgi:hypothetical protein